VSTSLLLHRLETDKVFRVWLVAWLGGSMLGVVNGTARELFYKEQVGDLTAHHISTATLIALLGLYVSMLERRWPIPTRQAAFEIGAAWLVLTILFEFGFGHYVDGKTWPELLQNYNLAEGRVWVLVVIWMGVAPATIRLLHMSKG